MIYEDYYHDLAVFPLDLVILGIERSRKKCTFWPKVSELLAEIEPLANARKVKIERVKQVLGARIAAEENGPDYNPEVAQVIGDLTKELSKKWRDEGPSHA